MPSPNFPDTDYVRSILELYRQLPHTPSQPRSDDRFLARQLQHRRVPLRTVHTALLLGSLRRLFPAEPQPPLQPIRSLRYFLPIVDELRYARLDDYYLTYLRRKLADLLHQPTLRDPQKSTPQTPTNQTQLSFDWS